MIDDDSPGAVVVTSAASGIGEVISQCLINNRIMNRL